MAIVPSLKSLCLKEIRDRHFEPLEKEMGPEELGITIGKNSSLDDLIEITLARDNDSLIEVILTHPDLDFESLFSKARVVPHDRVLGALISSPKVLTLSNEALNRAFSIASRLGNERVVMAILDSDRGRDITDETLNNATAQLVQNGHLTSITRIIHSDRFYDLTKGVRERIIHLASGEKRWDLVQLLMYSGVSVWDLLYAMQSASEDGQWDLVDKITRFSDFGPHEIPSKVIDNAYAAGQYSIAARLAKMKYSGLVIFSAIFAGTFAIFAQRNQPS